MKWIKIEDDLPDYDVSVLIYYTIEKDKKNKDADRFHRYFTIGYVQSITQGKNYKRAEWVDSDYNPITPTHWMPLPEPPKE